MTGGRFEEMPIGDARNAPIGRIDIPEEKKAMMFDPKTQNQFTVSFTVPSSRLQTVLGVIDGEIHNLKIEQVLPSVMPALEPLPAPPPQAIAEAPIRRSKPRRPGNGICPLILSGMVEGEIYEFSALAEKVGAEGWALNSTSPALSLLTQLGFLERQGKSIWSRTAKSFNPFEVLKVGE